MGIYQVFASVLYKVTVAQIMGLNGNKGAAGTERKAETSLTTVKNFYGIVALNFSIADI